MPLTFVIVAALGHVLAGLSWTSALVLGAVLAPTDPVFASALVGREGVPARVRHTLKVESGLNDGLALPAVLLLVGVAGGHPEGWTTDPWSLIAELAAGIGVGIALPVVINVLLRIPAVGAVKTLQPLGPLAVALILYGACDLLHANQFLAAFVAGATIGTIGPGASESFRHTGELISELAKGGALLAFATLLDADVFVTAGISGLVLAFAVILVSRPVPAYLALLGTKLSRAERLSVAWFGPKGFASVAYAVIVASSGMVGHEQVLALTALTVTVSIIAHSSTDVAVAHALSRRRTGDPQIPRSASR
jgi:NhaP-type Na+/H+ or K+/H+ antiporter